MPKAALWAQQCMEIKCGIFYLSLPANPSPWDSITGAPSVAKKYILLRMSNYSKI